MRKSENLKFFFYYLQPRTWCVWSEALFTGSFLWVWEFLSALHAVLFSILAYLAWLGRYLVELRHVKLELLTVLAKRENSSPGQHVIVFHITKVGFRLGCNCEIYPWVSTLFALSHETLGFDIPGAWPAWDYRPRNLLNSRIIVFPLILCHFCHWRFNITILSFFVADAGVCFNFFHRQADDNEVCIAMSLLWLLFEGTLLCRNSGWFCFSSNSDCCDCYTFYHLPNFCF